MKFWEYPERQISRAQFFLTVSDVDTLCKTALVGFSMDFPIKSSENPDLLLSLDNSFSTLRRSYVKKFTCKKYLLIEITRFPMFFLGKKEYFEPYATHQVDRISRFGAHTALI